MHREVREDAAALGDEAQRRRAPARRRCVPVTSSPTDVHATRRVGLSCPLATLSVVDFPAPFGPSSANTCRAGPSRSTSCEHVDRCRTPARTSRERERIAAPARSTAPAAPRSTPSLPADRRGAGCLGGGFAGAAFARGGRSTRGTRRARSGSPGSSAGRPVRDDPAEVEHVDVRRTCPSRSSCRARRAARRDRPPPGRASSAPSALVSPSLRPADGSSSRSTRGLARERTRDLDEARGAGRQLVDLLVGDRRAARRAR